jgi:hypothetical protein
MTLSFDPGDDFPNVVDGRQPVTVTRPDGSSSILVGGAVRASVSTAEARASQGKYTESDVVWHLPALEVTDPPALGDVIIDVAGRRWTVLAVRQATADARFRCVCRNLAIVHDLDTIIDIERAEFVKGENGAERAVWSPWRTGLAARIQPVQTAARKEHQRPITAAEFVVYIEEQLSLDHKYRVKTPDGTVYRVVGCEKAERIDSLMEISVVRVR